MGFLSRLIRYRHYRQAITTEKKATVILTTAEAQAHHILAIAGQRAETIVQDATRLRNSLEQHLNRIVADSKNIMDTHIQQELATLSEQLTTLTRTALTDLTQVTAEHIAGAARTNEQLLQQLHNRLTKIAEAEEHKMHHELTAIRQKKIHQLTAVLEKEIPTIVKEVVGYSIPLQDHEQLVRQALTKAYEEKIWL